MDHEVLWVETLFWATHHLITMEKLSLLGLHFTLSDYLW
jgi:hypothetical protein